MLGTGAHVRCTGKGRKERCTPLTKQTRAALKNWLKEPEKANTGIRFPNARGCRLSGDGVRYILAKHIAMASKTCPSLLRKKVTPHVLRHTTAMELLQAGVDRAVIALWLGHEWHSSDCNRPALVHVLDRQPLWNRCDRPIRYARYTSRKIRSDEVLIVFVERRYRLLRR